MMKKMAFTLTLLATGTAAAVGLPFSFEPVGPVEYQVLSLDDTLNTGAAGEVRLSGHKPECVYSGVITETQTPASDLRVVRLNARVCQGKAEKVDMITSGFRAGSVLPAGDELSAFPVVALPDNGHAFTPETFSLWAQQTQSDLSRRR
jgi:hypothetical protein